MTIYNTGGGNRQIKSTAAKAGPQRQSGPPEQDERGIALPLFRAAGRNGINRLHFLRGSGPLNGRLITQIGRLIHALEKEGYVFIHQKRSDSRFIYYVLVSEPLEPKKPAPAAPAKGWKAQFSFGRKQPQSVPVQENLGLYDSTVATGTDGAFLQFETGLKRVR